LRIRPTRRSASMDPRVQPPPAPLSNREGRPHRQVEQPGWASQLATHARRADGPVVVAVLCFTSDRANAAVTSHDIGRRLGEIGIRIPVRLWINDSVWVEFNTSATGRCSQDAADKMAAKSVYGRCARPAASRETMAASMAGDRKPVAALLKDGRAARTTYAAVRESAGMRVAEVLADGARLSDADAARLLVAVQPTSTRDALGTDDTRGLT
ncbi:MAG: hypothetical protein JWN97_2699, partial [Nocardioides sp.]|nr:hypothetical protein [Nocardioides sp.]